MHHEVNASFVYRLALIELIKQSNLLINSPIAPFYYLDFVEGGIGNDQLWGWEGYLASNRLCFRGMGFERLLLYLSLSY